MIRYRSLSAARADFHRRSCPVVTVGYFDGLHRGHQKLLEDLKAWAADLGGESVVITFASHPGRVLSGSAPAAVLSLDHRLLLLERQGVSATVVLEFDREISLWSPETFVERVLVESLGAHHLLLGFDSSIGHRRVGTHEYLSARAGELGITVRQSTPLLLGDLRISSTLVRQAVSEGDLARLREITARPYSLLGRVVTGDRRGRELGFPTANLEVEVETMLPGGVYFTTVDRVPAAGTDEGARAGRAVADHPALVNVGRRPTFTGRASAGELPRFDPALDRIEAHLLDFEGDLYGELLEVHFHRRHRGERRFDGPAELAEQLRRDEQALRAWLAGRA